jgi:hypothetical protein
MMRTARWLLAVSILAPVALGGAAASAGASAIHPARVAPRAATTTDVNTSLAATADRAGDQFVFWKGQDGNLWYTVYDAGTASWSTAAAVPGMGPLGSEPTVALEQYELIVGPASLRPESLRPESLRPDLPLPTIYLWVMWEGTNGNLWTVEGTIPSGDPPTDISWQSTPTAVPAFGTLGSAPAATFVTSDTNSGLDVFWKGTDGELWSADGTVSDGAVTWPTSPTALPAMGTLGSAPTAGSDYAGNIYVFWQGSGNNTHVWEGWYNNQAATPAWSSGPIDLGQFSGNTGSAPSAAVSGNGQQFIFWQGQDGNLYFAEWTGEVLGGPVDDIVSSSDTWLNNSFNYVGDGPMDSAPAAAVTLGGSSGSVDVFWKGTNLNIWMASSPTSAISWTGPTSVGDGPLDGQ